MFDGFETEEEYLESLKQDDSYHFSIPFEYIKKNYGNGQYDIGVTNMEVDVVWSELSLGYQISYYVPDMDLIDPEEGNSDVDEFYDWAVAPIIEEKLDDLGVFYEIIA